MQARSFISAQTVAVHRLSLSVVTLYKVGGFRLIAGFLETQLHLDFRVEVYGLLSGRPILF